MKKITFCALALAGFGLVTNAQVTLSEVAGVESNVIRFQDNRSPEEACSQEIPSNAVENGLGNTNAGVEVADAFVVGENETFMLESATVYILNNGGWNDVNVAVYPDDTLGMPDITPIFSETLVPDEDNIVGVGFGRDIHELVFNFDPPIELVGGDSGETPFWLGIETPNPIDPASDAFWETTTIDGTDYLVSARNTGGAWGPTSSGVASTVFTVAGDCETLGVNENVLASVSVYPNPATNVINLDVKNNISIETVAVYDILGKRTSATLTGNTINIASLNSGLYMVEVTTENGNTATYKVVKQ